MQSLMTKLSRRGKHRGTDQQPFIGRSRFSALPDLRRMVNGDESLSFLFATLYAIDLLGIFPIVSVPASFIRCGLYAIPLVVVVIALQIYTALLLGKCWLIAERIKPCIVQQKRAPYPAIAEMAYGKYMSYIVVVLQDISVFATCIPNFLVAAQNLQLFGHRVSDGHFYFSFCLWLVVIGAFVCPFMWLGSPKNMKILVVVSLCVISCVIVLLIYCIASTDYGIPPFNNISTDLPSFLDVLAAYSVMAFQFDIHPMILTIQIDMEDKRQIGKAVTYGILNSCVISVIVTVLAAYKFGSIVPDNLLEILPRSPTLYATLLLISVQLCFSATIGSIALFHHIETILGIAGKFSYKRCLLRSFLVGLEVLIAELLPNFNVLMGVVGGTLTGPLIFIFPPLFYRRICQLERKHDSRLVQRTYGSVPMDLNFQSGEADKVPVPNVQKPTLSNKMYQQFENFSKFLYKICSFSIAVVVFGIIATIASTYLNMFEVSEVFRTRSPCFTNLSYSFNNL